jgi:hypothetical protein
VLTYAAVIIVVAAVLYLSFRALSGGEPVAAEDYRAVLTRIAGFVDDRAAQIDAVMTHDTQSKDQPREQRHLADDALEVAAAARKALSGYQQRLSSLETQAGGDERETLETARSLLSAAIEDYGWVCRMLESGTWRDNPGVQRATEALSAHGSECRRSAMTLLAESERVESGR